MTGNEYEVRDAAFPQAFDAVPVIFNIFPDVKSQLVSTLNLTLYPFFGILSTPFSTATPLGSAEMSNTHLLLPGGILAGLEMPVQFPVE